MFKVLTEGCEPTRGSKYSACVDLYASEDIIIGAGETAKVGLSVCINEEDLYHNWYRSTINHPTQNWKEFKNSHYLQLMPRSSLRAKGLISNVGVIDLDYLDEIKIIIHNPFNNVYDEKMNNKGTGAYKVNKQFEIKKGERIAQITLLEHKSYLMGYETEAERNGGFGSTGK